MTKSILLCLVVTSVIAGPPFRPLNAKNFEKFLMTQCRAPTCPPNEGAPVILPYPLDCFQYIICEESGPRIVTCPRDLVFNKNTSKCDTPQNANCLTCWQQPINA